MPGEQDNPEVKPAVQPTVDPAVTRTISLFDKIWNDPDVGAQVRKAAKKIDPTIVIPDDNPIVVNAYREINTLKEQFTGLEKLHNEFVAKTNQEKDEAALRGSLGTIQQKFGFTDDAMAKTIEIMQQRNIADPEAAALLYRESLPKQKPSAGSSMFLDTRPNLYGTQSLDDKWAQLHDDPDAFFRDTVQQVFDEIPAAA